jgi:hypothetical protein
MTVTKGSSDLLPILVAWFITCTHAPLSVSHGRMLCRHVRKWQAVRQNNRWKDTQAYN